MAGRSTVRDVWALRREDPQGLAAYELFRAGVTIPAVAAPVPVWQLVGPATDRLRLDAFVVEPGSSVYPVSVEFVVRASSCDVLGPVVIGPFVVTATEQGQAGYVCEVRGRITTSWDVLARCTTGQPLRLSLRALVDRIGGPFEVDNAAAFLPTG